MTGRRSARRRGPPRRSSPSRTPALASQIAHTGKSKYGNHSWKVTGTLTRNGAWRTVKSAKTYGQAGRRGTVAIVWDPPSSRNYRMYYAYTYADASGTFWLRNR